MDLTPAGLLIGLVFSGVGLVYLRFGKKQDNWPIMFTGLALLVETYMVKPHWAQVTVGIILSLLPFILKWW